MSQWRDANTLTVLLTYPGGVVRVYVFCGVCSCVCTVQRIQYPPCIGRSRYRYRWYAQEVIRRRQDRPDFMEPWPGTRASCHIR